jgi:hypothetical protein
MTLSPGCRPDVTAAHRPERRNSSTVLIEKVGKEGHMDALALVDTFGVLSPHAMKYSVTQVQARIPKRLEAYCRPAARPTGSTCWSGRLPTWTSAPRGPARAFAASTNRGSCSYGGGSSRNDKAPGSSPRAFYFDGERRVKASYCKLICAVFTTFSHLSESFLISAVNCSPGSVITTSC